MGKTSVLVSYTKGKAPTEYIPTVFDNCEFAETVDGTLENLSLWDTAGQEEFASIRPLSYPETNIFMVCFSVDAMNSLTNIEQKWLPEIRQHEPNVPFFIVGTKADLREDDGIVEEKKALGKPMRSPEELKEQALAWGAVGYLECSAITRVGLVELFHEVIRQSRKHKDRTVVSKVADKKKPKEAGGAGEGGGGCCVVS